MSLIPFGTAVSLSHLALRGADGSTGLAARPSPANTHARYPKLEALPALPWTQTSASESDTCFVYSLFPTQT